MAAGEFARAASGTGSAEALRTLRLLEQHHQRLSELLRYPTENPPKENSAEAEVQQVSEKPISTSAAVAELRASKSELGPRTSSPSQNPPGLPRPRSLPPRDLSSSIASNLASARGIRSNYTRQPLSPSVSSHQAPGTLEALPRKDKKAKVPASIPEHFTPSWVPPAVIPPPEQVVDTSANDEGFSRFYSTFGNILNKISAPLAFAGLPLIAEEPLSTPTSPPEPAPSVKTITKDALKKTAPRSRSSSQEPDLTKYISRVALNAIARDGKGVSAVNDSFYLVPTTGHTASYAQILSFDQKEKRRMAASMHSENADLFADPEDDDFVDAREHPSPETSRRSFAKKSSGKVAGGRDVEIKIEELEIENQSLKKCIDKLSARLYAFEMSAQQNTFALNESMRLMRDLSPARPELMSRGSGGPVSLSAGGDEKLRRQIEALELEMKQSRMETERARRENEKLKDVVARYRDRWEKLKAGAKTRREGTASSSPKDRPGGGGSRDVGGKDRAVGAVKDRAAGGGKERVKDVDGGYMSG